jgi:hypothetical protein
MEVIRDESARNSQRLPVKFKYLSVRGQYRD